MLQNNVIFGLGRGLLLGYGSMSMGVLDEAGPWTVALVILGPWTESPGCEYLPQRLKKYPVLF